MRERFPRIERAPGSGDDARIISRDVELMARSCRRLFPIVVKRVEGSIVFDLNGNAYIDFTGGFGSLPLGGQHPEVVKALKARVDGALSAPPQFYSEEVVELAEELARIAPIRGDVRILLRDSGSEAVDAAVWAMRWHSGKNAVLTFLGEHHGSIGAASMLSTSFRAGRCSTRILDALYAPGRDCAACPIGLDPERCRAECLDLARELIEAAAPGDLAAILFEPISLKSIVPPPAHFIEALARLARDVGGLLVANERFTAPARTGRWFASDHWNLKADAVCLGDQLASGLPIGVLIAREELLDLEPLEHEACAGNMLSISAALTTLRVIRDEGLVERGERLGRNVLRAVRELAEELGWKAYGVGMLIGMRPAAEDERAAERKARAIVSECFRVGLLLWRMGSTILITPSLTIEEEVLERGLEIFGEKVSEVSRLSRAS